MLIPRFSHPGLRAFTACCALAAPTLCLPLLATAQVAQEDALDIPTVKISPVARITPLDEAPLSDKTLKLLQAMVRQPLVLSDTQVSESARIASTRSVPTTRGKRCRCGVSACVFFGNCGP